VAVAAACGQERAPGTLTHKDSVAIAAVQAESARASRVAAARPTGLWDLDAVSERLVRSGVAPRRMTPAPKVPRFFASAKETGAFYVGRDAELHVFVFSDSVARKLVTDKLDTATAAPPGTLLSPWPKTPLLIVVQNLAAVVFGGSPRLQERVQLGLEAGRAQ